MTPSKTKSFLLTLFLTLSLLLPSAIKAVAAEVTLQDIVTLILNNRPLFAMAESRGIILPPLIKKVLLTGTLTQADLDGISSSNTAPSYTRDLTVGISGSDVTTLQTYLINQNKGPQARVLGASGASGYFGVLTKAALIEYQASIGLSPSGVLDLATRNYLNKSTTSSSSSSGGTVRSGGGGGGGSGGSSTPTPIPLPSVTLSPSVSSITTGQSLSLTWSSNNATSCTASNGWSGTKATSGTQSVSPTTDTTFTLSCTGSGGTTVQNVSISVGAVANPGTVSDLRLSSATTTSATLAFTEVTDGTGSPSKYDMRYAPGTIVWGSAGSVGSGTCSTPISGSTIGATKTCTVTGLSPSTAYQFQLAPYRGTLNVNAVFGSLSNILSVTTSAVSTPTDTTAPTVSISAPSNGSTLSNSVTVSATASDNVGVSGVQFKLDGSNLGSEDTSSPYSLTWDTTTASNGTHTITAVARDAAGNTTTSSSVSVTVSNTVSGSSEPTYNSASQTLVWQDNFNAYNTFSDAVASGWRSVDDGTTQDFDGSPGGSNLIINPGRDGSGKGIRLVYTGINHCGSQECRAWSRSISDTLAAKPGHAIYISYYFRMNPGGGYQLDQDADHIIKVKWLELWRTTLGDRAQFNTSYSQCVNDVPFTGASGSGTLFQFYGQAGGNTTCQAGQVRPPFAYQGAGQWHRATHKYVTQSASGARDGIAQMWVDGTLVMSVAQGYCNVAVPGALGAAQPGGWCLNADLDAMFVNAGTDKLTLGSVQTAALWPFSIDYDDIVLWRD